MNSTRPKTREPLPRRQHSPAPMATFGDAMKEATHQKGGHKIAAGLAVTSRVTVGGFTLIVMPVIAHGTAFDKGGVSGTRARNEALRQVQGASSYEREQATKLWPRIYGAFSDNQHEGWAGAAVVAIDPTTLTGISVAETLVIAITPMGVSVYAYPLHQFRGQSPADFKAKYTLPAFNAARRIDNPLFTVLSDEAITLIRPYMDGDAVRFDGFDGSEASATAARLTTAFIATQLHRMSEDSEGMISKEFAATATQFLSHSMLRSAGVGSVDDSNVHGCTYKPVDNTREIVSGSMTVTRFVTRLADGVVGTVHAPVIERLSAAMAEARAAEIELAALRMSGGVVDKVLRFLDAQGWLKGTFDKAAARVNDEFQFEQRVGDEVEETGTDTATGDEVEETGTDTATGEETDDDTELEVEAVHLPEVLSTVVCPVTLLLELKSPEGNPKFKERAAALWTNMCVVFGDENEVMSTVATKLVEAQYESVADAVAKAAPNMEDALHAAFTILEEWKDVEFAMQQESAAPADEPVEVTPA